MKKYIPALLACVFLLLSACAPSGLSSGETTTAPTETTATPTVTTAPIRSVIDLREYDCGIDNSVFNDDTLKELIRQADEILNSGEEFWLENNYYLDYLCVSAPNAIPAKRGSKIVVEFPFEGREDRKTDGVRYLIVLQFITKEYADCIYAKRTDPVTTQFDPIMHLSTNYSKYGYTTIDDYLDAAANGKCEWDKEDYTFSLSSDHIGRVRLPEDIYGPLVDEVLQAQQED